MTIHAQTEHDGSAIVTVDGQSQKIRGTSLDDVRAKVRDFAVQYASRTGIPVEFASSDPVGEFTMVVHPDGRMENAGAVAVPTTGELQSLLPPEESRAVAPAPPVIAPLQATAGSHPTASLSGTPMSRREARAARTSFLQAPEAEQSATKGPRAWGRFVGLHLSPSENERGERTDRRCVGQHFPGARTISIANGKGSSGKTPAAAELAAAFALYGGVGVLAWDNNQTRGTLGWRTEQGPHDATLLELLEHAHDLLGPNAQAADLHKFVHHQTEDLFDVLRSKPSALASEQRITPEDVSLIHAVATKYYRMIIMDSGNDESDPLWRQMIRHSDQLVVPVTTREDTREAGALLLEDLAALDERSARLADEAVVIVSQAEPSASAADIAQAVAQFRPFVREVVTIPFDPALVSGIIRHGALRPATQRAWLAAAAAVARGL